MWNLPHSVVFCTMKEYNHKKGERNDLELEGFGIARIHHQLY